MRIASIELLSPDGEIGPGLVRIDSNSGHPVLILVDPASKAVVIKWAGRNKERIAGGAA